MVGGKLRLRPLPDVPAWCPATICKLSRYPSHEQPRSLNLFLIILLVFLFLFLCRFCLSCALFVNIMFTHVLPIMMLFGLFALNYPQSLFFFCPAKLRKPIFKMISHCNLQYFAIWLLSFASCLDVLCHAIWSERVSLPGSFSCQRTELAECPAP